MKETIYDKVVHYMCIFATVLLLLMFCMVLIAYRVHICENHGMKYNVFVGCVNE